MLCQVILFYQYKKKTKLLLHKLSAEIITTARLQPNILDFFFSKKEKKKKKKRRIAFE